MDGKNHSTECIAEHDRAVGIEQPSDGAIYAAASAPLSEKRQEQLDKVNQDLVLFGTAFTKNGKYVPLDEVFKELGVDDDE